jgi:PPP family 3-phenylpropionic acid transporter
MPIATRLGLYYAAIFTAGGVAGPYFGVWFKDHGLTGAQIGAILAAPAIARVVTGPAIAVWADGFRLRRTPLVLLGVAVATLFVAFAFTREFWAWFVLWLAAQSAFGALSPLTDIIALRRARSDRFNYGAARAVGSAAYIFANVVGGLLLARLTSDVVLIWVIASVTVIAVSGRWLLPDDPVHEDGEVLDRSARWRGLGALAADPVFMLLVVSVGLIQTSHAFYYGFSALLWKAQGLPESVTGVLWGIGVGAEVIFLWLMEPWRRAMGPVRLLLFGGLGALVRWTCLAMSPPLWLLLPLQTLHALSFTATFMATLSLIERLSPARSASAAQTLNAVLSGGVLMGVGSLASGVLYDHAGPLGYLVMSACAASGLAGVVLLRAILRRRAQSPLS